MKRYARLALEGDRVSYAELTERGAELLDGAPWLGGRPTAELLEGIDEGTLGAHRLLAPVEPRTILCVGRNYRAHAKELGNEVPVEPMLFYKPVTALLDPGGTLELPPTSISSRVEHEAELAVVVGRRLRRASLEEAAAGVFGLTIACDVTARDLQKKDGQWWRAKGMDGFCPVGPVIVTGLDAGALEIECRVDGELRQSGHTRDMIFSIATVLSHVSQVITLNPGDLILTGTPEGVGPIPPGSRVSIRVAPIGVLEFVAAASSGDR